MSRRHCGGQSANFDCPKFQLIGRVDKIIDAIRQAMETANMSVDVDDKVDLAKSFFEYAFAPLSTAFTQKV